MDRTPSGNARPGREPEAEESLLEVLQRRGPLTAEAAAAALWLSRSAVLRQLATLGRQGLVERRVMRGEIGRPRFSYDVTPVAQGYVQTDYETISLQLLAAATEVGGSEMVARLFDAWRRQMATRIRDEFRHPGVADEVLAERVEALAAWQEARGFAVETRRLGGLRSSRTPVRSAASRCPRLQRARPSSASSAMSWGRTSNARR